MCVLRMARIAASAGGQNSGAPISVKTALCQA